MNMPIKLMSVLAACVAFSCDALVLTGQGAKTTLSIKDKELRALQMRGCCAAGGGTIGR